MKGHVGKGLAATIALMLLFSLCACARQSEPTVSSASPTVVGPSGSAESSAPAEKSWLKDISPVTLDWYIHTNWYTAKWGEDLVSKYITEKTGVSLNLIVPAGNEDEKLNIMIASNSLPDILSIPWYVDGARRIVDGKLVVPWNQLADQFDKTLYDNWSNALAAWTSDANGNVYGYPNCAWAPDRIKPDTKVTTSDSFLVRKDIYEALGKPDMRTPEGFINALKAAKEQFPTVDGKPLIPFGTYEFTDFGNAGLEDMLFAFLALPVEKDGRLYHRGEDPEYIRWMKTFRKMNEMGLIDKDIFVDKTINIQEKIAQTRYFALLFTKNDAKTANENIYKTDPSKVYICVDGPANSRLDPPKLHGGGPTGWLWTFISKDNKNPERTIKFLNYGLSYEGQHDFFFGKKGETWDVINGKDSILPAVKADYDADGASAELKYGTGYRFWMLQDSIYLSEWKDPEKEPTKQCEEWGYGKTVSYAQYENTAPPSDSDMGIYSMERATEWGLLLPKLILAPSEAEFDKLWNDYLARNNEAMQTKTDDFVWQNVLANKKKLGIK